MSSKEGVFQSIRWFHRSSRIKWKITVLKMFCQASGENLPFSLTDLSVSLRGTLPFSDDFSPDQTDSLWTKTSILISFSLSLLKNLSIDLGYETSNYSTIILASLDFFSYFSWKHLPSSEWRQVIMTLYSFFSRRELIMAWPSSLWAPVTNNVFL